MTSLADAPRQADATLAACLAPRAIAVIGAGRTGGVGHSILQNLRRCYQGRLYPVNPHAVAIDGVPTFHAVSEIPNPVDLAVIAIPAAGVDAALDDCLRASVRGVVLISAGFAEAGHADAEAAVRDRARAAGLRLIGPNCVGVINTAGHVSMNASLAPALPPAGHVAFASQSGALGLAMLERARQMRLGISSFVSIGNGADVGFEDLIAYWGQDRETKAILLYAESFGSPRRFIQVARTVSGTKPILLLKSGRSAVGARAASSHTAALTQADTLVDAMCLDAGVTRVDTLEELFATAQLLSYQPHARGRRIAIVSNAGGPGILAADACVRRGLPAAELSPGTASALREFLPASASVQNPVDMIATASASDFERTIHRVSTDPGVDALVVMFIPLSTTSTTDVAAAVARAAERTSKPVVSCFFGAADAALALGPIPCFDYPEVAVDALARAAWHDASTATTATAPTASAIAPPGAVGDLLAPVAGTSTWLTTDTVRAVLTAAGIPMVPTTVAGTAREAVATARAAGYPVVLKGTGPRLLHKTDAHAVITGIDTEAALVDAFASLAARSDVHQIVLQPMVRGGVEMFVGSLRDERFGHAVTGGIGGIFVELFRDSATRLTPVSAEAAGGMVDQLRGAPLLRGFRGGPPLNEPAFTDILLRVSRLVEAAPQIAELDLNPVIVTETAAVVVDARIRVD